MLKVIPFIETVENVRLDFFTHTLSRISDRKFDFIRTKFISQCNKAFFRMLDRIIDKIGKELAQPYMVEREDTRLQTRLTAKLHTPMKFYFHGFYQIFQKVFQLYIYRFEFDRIRFYLRQIEHIGYQLQ